MSTLTNKGICLVQVSDYNKEEGYRNVNVGNYFEDDAGNLFVVTTLEMAKKYYQYINVPILTRNRGTLWKSNYKNY